MLRNKRNRVFKAFVQENYKQHEDVAWCQDWTDVWHYFYFPTLEALRKGRGQLVQIFFLEKI